MSITTTFAALASSAALLLFAAPMNKDYTTIPPSPDVVEKQLGEAKLTLAQAIEAACKDAGGRAGSAEMKFEGGKAVAQVRVYAGGKAWNCSVDTASGAITKSEHSVWSGDPVTGEWITTPSGLRYTDLRPGTGARPGGPQTQVKVHYTGWLLDGTEFDSSVKRNQPATFFLNGVIAGWTEGVGSMQVGGKRKLCIPYALAYGASGRPPIPPKATLVFDVELLEITKP
ncbi:MAG: FKBP-type peptidyl-prolyl cis-trans isomerase [Planctomycetota bacterium]